MILTGLEIIKQLNDGTISISPFDLNQVNPNSYNYRLGETLKVYTGKPENNYLFEEITIPESGYILQPRNMYLGATYESIGSSTFSMSLIGRSSMGRLGLFLQLSANLGHVTSDHHWTLEMYCAKPIKIYPKMIIGQVSFWVNEGPETIYQGRYGKINEPQENLELSTSDNNIIL